MKICCLIENGKRKLSAFTIIFIIYNFNNMMQCFGKKNAFFCSFLFFPNAGVGNSIHKVLNG